MNQETFTTVDQKQTGGSHLFNTRKVFTMMLRNWYIYILGIALAGGGAYMFLKHKIPTYSVETLILIGPVFREAGKVNWFCLLVAAGSRTFDGTLLVYCHL